MSALPEKDMPHVRAGMIGFLALAFVSLFAGAASARDITDMSGQTVTVPDDIKSVYAMTHAMPLLTAIAPDLAAGFGMPLAPKPEILRFLPPSMAKLPSLGGGSNFNLEKLKENGVDLALGWASPEERYPANQMKRIGIPVVNIDVDRLDQYPATFRFLGKLFHREARGEELAKALEETAAAAKAATKDIPAAEKPKVFYADSIDGLSSQCDASGRLEVIAFAGGVNALDCNVTENYPIDIEKLIAINPDVIITRFAQAAKTMREDPRFAELKAVKAGRVYSIPAYPFNWVDRPPSFARALGVRWLAAKLYPDRASFDLRGETRKFYTQFFGVTPTGADLDLLFAQ